MHISGRSWFSQAALYLSKHTRQLQKTTDPHSPYHTVIFCSVNFNDRDLLKKTWSSEQTVTLLRNGFPPIPSRLGPTLSHVFFLQKEKRIMLNHAVLFHLSQPCQAMHTDFSSISRSHRLLTVCEKSHLEITKQTIIPLGFLNTPSGHIKIRKVLEKILIPPWLRDSCFCQ